MAEYKVVDAEKLDADLSSVADAIRTKGGTSESLTFPQGFVDAVGAIESGGGEDDFIGVKFLAFGNNKYKLPTIVDASSIPIETGKVGGCFNSFFRNHNHNANGGFYVYMQEVYLPDELVSFDEAMFYFCVNLTTLHGDFSKVRSVAASAFDACYELAEFPYMPNLESISAYAFNKSGLTTVKLPNTITSIASSAFINTNITDIYVPWAEGAVANAPWGATKATIHYNSEV